MADLAEVYDLTRKELASLVSSLDEAELERTVPATPAWRIRDVIAHLSGDVVCLLDNDFPREFFQAIGDPAAIVVLNDWTDKQVKERRAKSLQDILDEWERATPGVAAMISGEDEWPEGVLPYAGHILTTDLATHQQDIFGALGIVKERDSAQIRVGAATFMGGVALRLQLAGEPSLRFRMEDKEFVAGGGHPQATVTGPRYELFRALSGRRNPDQIRAFEWDGDPEPFLNYFYPYGVRADALVE
jgi:uncharacterized protein (TIGR03083 family)